MRALVRIAITVLEVAIAVWLFVFAVSLGNTGLSRPPGWHADPRAVFVPRENVFADAFGRATFAIVLTSPGILVSGLALALVSRTLFQRRRWQTRLVAGGLLGAALGAVVLWLSLAPVATTRGELGIALGYSLVWVAAHALLTPRKPAEEGGA